MGRAARLGCLLACLCTRGSYLSLFCGFVIGQGGAPRMGARGGGVASARLERGIFLLGGFV